MKWSLAFGGVIPPDFLSLGLASSLASQLPQKIGVESQFCKRHCPLWELTSDSNPEDTSRIFNANTRYPHSR
jgi:hypothetical protein